MKWVSLGADVGDSIGAISVTRPVHICSLQDYSFVGSFEKAECKHKLSKAISCFREKRLVSN